MTSRRSSQPPHRHGVSRRTLLVLGGGALATPLAGAGLVVGSRQAAAPNFSLDTAGRKLAAAAMGQLGVTTGYDGAYRKIAYPDGDVPRHTGVCADVVIRAARDGLGLDLQRLVHQDMSVGFSDYPQAWGLTRPDPNIDHRRVRNLEVFWRRAGAELWNADRSASRHPKASQLEIGDLLTWRCFPRGGPHVAVITRAGASAAIAHNIGLGVMRWPLWMMAPHALQGHYRWPVA
jgi:uncharacterized protein YijF (DUF1287 family)